MKTVTPTRKFKFAIIISGLLGLMLYACSSKTYVSTYTDRDFNPGNISKMAVVLEDVRVTEQYNLVFADTFIRTALEKNKFALVEDTYILKETLPRSKSGIDADAFIEISLTHCYPGNQSDNFPTSVGAQAKIVDPETSRLLWSVNYAYASSKSGASAPMMEEAMAIVSEKIIESIPLEDVPPGIAAYKLPDKMRNEDGINHDLKAEAMKELESSTQSLANDAEGIPQGEEAASKASDSTPAGDMVPKPDPNYAAYHDGAYVIHVASVRKKPIAADFADKDSADGTLRICAKMDADPEKLWYRLMIGRFSTLEATQSYIDTLKTRGDINGYAKPMKLPYSLLISAGHPLDPSRKIVEALRRIDYMAYLSPSNKTPDTFDVFVGAFRTEEEAGERARLLVKNGIPVSVVAY